VCVCMCGCVCVCVWVCVCVCVCVCVSVDFIMCRCFGNMCTCIYCPLYSLYGVLHCFLYVQSFLSVLSVLV